jgi:4-aminobutyrate aminotransferase-like enzyme
MPTEKSAHTEEVPCIATQTPGPRTRGILHRQSRYLAYELPTRTRVVWDQARRAVITDLDCSRPIDHSSGVPVTDTGHSHLLIVDRLTSQIQRLMHCHLARSQAQVGF